MEVLLLAKTLEYKGHPFQRKDNIIYYGSFADKYIIMLQILETSNVSDLSVATKVSVQLSTLVFLYHVSEVLHRLRL